MIRHIIHVAGPAAVKNSSILTNSGLLYSLSPAAFYQLNKNTSINNIDHVDQYYCLYSAGSLINITRY